MPDNIIIQGRNIPYIRAVVGVNECVLDPQNPRIQFLIGQRAGGVSECDLEELIWEKDAVKALGQSILQNGGVYEPVIVQRRGARFLVREGNCRTVVCRRLLEQRPNDTRFNTMPAMIFDVELTEEDLAILLADMHVSGKLRWDAYEQAKHVSDLFHVYGKTYEWLSNHLRLSKGKIRELLEAYQTTTEYLSLHPTPGNVRKFAVFHEMTKKKDLRERFKCDSRFKQSFHKWVDEERISDSRQVRDLPMILANAEAVKALDQLGFEEAQKVLVREDPSLRSDAFYAIKQATEKIKTLPADDIQDLKAGNPQKVVLMRNLYRAIEDVATLAGMKL
ncbi:MAG TPA: hypothetical protein VKU19_21190 [Bryobacteraceae bacterium]|nr:hypothetical protein [Bryobacteraceae bacterium]